MIPFKKFPKIGRLSRDMIITEKLDGTNGQVYIIPASEIVAIAMPDGIEKHIISKDVEYAILAGSRNRWIKPGKKDDNAGFAGWVHDNAQELVDGLGEGQHFGEWWGQGIQRNYGLKEKRFSLFNTARWSNDEVRPKCCHVVPVLYEGKFCTEQVRIEMDCLSTTGSKAAPGFMKPEGVVVFHTQAQNMFKKTFEKDEAGKSYGA